MGDGGASNARGQERVSTGTAVTPPGWELEQAIGSRRAVVTVAGLGYVGLPAAVAFARAGYPVVGIDVDPAKVDAIGAGRSPVPEVTDAELKDLVRADGPGPRLRASRTYEAVTASDVILICVPTPRTRNMEPDTSHIEAAAGEIARYGRAGQLIVLRSTSYPTTTGTLVGPLLERGGRSIGRDVFLAFAPERIDPGRLSPPAADIPVLVGGVEPRSTELARRLFSAVARTVVVVSSAETAEMAKLLENVFRNVNIALVNQLAMLCDRMGLDIWEIIDAAATKPYGFMRFAPGPGVGGHCIPVDPYYLAWKAREFDFHMDFIELAARVNDEMPYFVVEKVLRSVGALSGGRRRLLVLGVTFKRDVADARHSPSVKIIELLRSRGVEVDYHDPFVPSLMIGGVAMTSRPLTPDALRGYDGVVIATDHSSLDYQWIVDHAQRVVDTRNATKDIVQGRDRIVRL